MDVKWLQDFLTVAELGNFTRAAETLHSSQAALSRRIQSLEAWLGTTLIDRSIFPTRLTAEGDRFRHYAAEILRQVVDARGELSGTPARGHVRIALPFALATASLPDWWDDWARDRSLTCSLVVGNVHDMMTALVAGSVDFLVCFHNAQQPIQLNAEHYERIVLRVEQLRPYASPKLLEGRGPLFPGRPDRPVPLLTYSPGVYFGRLVELALEAAPVKIHGRRIIESDMSDVLRDLAVAGHGVAWLPECTVGPRRGGTLVPVDDGSLSLAVATIAYRNRSNDRPAVERLWQRLVTMAGDGLAGTVADAGARPTNDR